MTKRLVRVLIAIIILIIVAGTYLIYDRYEIATNRDIPELNILFNDEKIMYTSASYKEVVIDPYWIIDVDLEVDHSSNSFTTDMSVNKLDVGKYQDVNVTCTNEANEVLDLYHDGSLIFDVDGKYLINVKIIVDEEQENLRIGSYSFNFEVDVRMIPKIAISNQEPVLGELVQVDISDINESSIVNVDCEFEPSAILTNTTTRMFYVPITYYKAVKEYPLIVKIDDKEYQYVLDVKDYDFSEISFKVSSTVTSQTVNSDEANQEYREKVHPLYKTKSSELYLNGSFIKPVQERRISSEFGQKRYINNATSPKRHSGIDYAADCKTEVYATNDGVIELSEFLKLSGNTVVIEHGLGLKSYYMHMDDVVLKAGDMVKKGDLIGHVGQTGYATGCHLHFQISIDNQPINPELLY